MRLTASFRHRAGIAVIVSVLFLLLVSCAREATPPGIVEASLLTAVLIGGPLLGVDIAVVALLRRRRGPEPLARLLIAGSLRDMQRPRPYRRGEP